MQDLQQLIRLAADEAGGYRTLAARSRGAVSHSTLNNLATGRHSGRLKPVQLSGVAMAIGRPAPEVARLLGQAYADPGRPFTMPERANALTPSQRKVVLSVVDTILAAADQAASAPGPAKSPSSQEKWAKRQVARERRLSGAESTADESRPTPTVR